ncbi:hypothetical protein NESM_000209600 [Novymonas esmeraldas]|uniref:Uncharacterized protein n=1 Tax=Novymonas esmeraldas TaxID=1808958 RepID=A0AAW0F6N1_9TRYP
MGCNNSKTKEPAQSAPPAEAPQESHSAAAAPPPPPQPQPHTPEAPAHEEHGSSAASVRGDSPATPTPAHEELVLPQSLPADVDGGGATAPVDSSDVSASVVFATTDTMELTVPHSTGKNSAAVATAAAPSSHQQQQQQQDQQQQHAGPSTPPPSSPSTPPPSSPSTPPPPPRQSIRPSIIFSRPPRFAHRGDGGGTPAPQAVAASTPQPESEDTSRVVAEDAAAHSVEIVEVVEVVMEQEPPATPLLVHQQLSTSDARRSTTPAAAAAAAATSSLSRRPASRTSSSGLRVCRVRTVHSMTPTPRNPVASARAPPRPTLEMDAPEELPRSTAQLTPPATPLLLQQMQSNSGTLHHPIPTTAANPSARPSSRPPSSGLRASRVRTVHSLTATPRNTVASTRAPAEEPTADEDWPPYASQPPQELTPPPNGLAWQPAESQQQQQQEEEEAGDADRDVAVDADEGTPLQPQLIEERPATPSPPTAAARTPQPSESPASAREVNMSAVSTHRSTAAEVVEVAEVAEERAGPHPAAAATPPVTTEEEEVTAAAAATPRAVQPAEEPPRAPPPPPTTTTTTALPA